MCCDFAGNFLHFKTTSGGSKSECRKSPAQLWLVQVGESQSAGNFRHSYSTYGCVKVRHFRHRNIIPTQYGNLYHNVQEISYKIEVVFVHNFAPPVCAVILLETSYTLKLLRVGQNQSAGNLRHNYGLYRWVKVRVQEFSWQVLLVQVGQMHWPQF
jgi:hypothetical protein